MLQHWTESSIIPASRKKSVWRKWKLTMKTDSFGGRQIACLIYEHFRVTGANDSVENYADLFLVVLQNDNIQEFDTKCDEILLSMTQIPSDDILENLYNLRIRESEKVKTVLKLYKYGDSSEESRTWLSQIEDDGKKEVSSRIWERIILRPETEVLKQAPWSRIRGIKQREQRSLGDCWQWKANGQCSKGDNCSFRHDKDKRAKSTQPNLSPRASTQQSVKNASRTKSPSGRSPSGEIARQSCKDYLKGTCTAPFCEKWHLPECLFYKSENGCRFGDKCSYLRIARLMNSLAKGLKRIVKKCSGYIEEYTTVGLRISGCGAAEVFIDFGEELNHSEANPMCSIHQSHIASRQH